MAFTGVIVIAVLIAVAVAVAGGAVVSIFNSLVQVNNNIQKAFANIDVLLQQRHDELTKLIDAVKGYMKHERDLLDHLTELRVGYNAAPSPVEKIRVENELNRGLNKLRMVWEGYPDLKASQNFLQAQERISALESSIADRREFFNDSVNIYNIQIEQFPHLLLAGILGYRRHGMLEIPDEAKKDVKLNFS